MVELSLVQCHKGYCPIDRFIDSGRRIYKLPIPLAFFPFSLFKFYYYYYWVETERVLCTSFIYYSHDFKIRTLLQENIFYIIARNIL